MTILSIYQSLSQIMPQIFISVSSATINLFCIMLLSRFYAWLAVKLTRLENQRTDEDYENSYTLKMYCFQFVNYYSSIFYVAFFKVRFDSCVGWSVNWSVGWSVDNAFVRRSTRRTLLAYSALFLGSYLDLEVKIIVHSFSQSESQVIASHCICPL